MQEEDIARQTANNEANIRRTLRRMFKQIASSDYRVRDVTPWQSYIYIFSCHGNKKKAVYRTGLDLAQHQDQSVIRGKGLHVLYIRNLLVLKTEFSLITNPELSNSDVIFNLQLLLNGSYPAGCMLFTLCTLINVKYTN